MLFTPNPITSPPIICYLNGRHVQELAASNQLITTHWQHKNSNANNIARVANSQLTNADEKLHPLLSLKNGRTLEKFPDTSKALAKLSGELISYLSFLFDSILDLLIVVDVVTVVDAMLSALEADRTGNEMEKREKLRLQIGLKPNPA